MKRLTFNIEGEKQSIDLAQELEISDLEAERARVAAQIAYWGALVAAADAAAERLEAELEHWTGKCVDKLLAADPKMAEWKCKPATQAQDDFLERRRTIIAAKEEAAKAKAVYNGFTRKHDILKAMTSREGGERFAAGDVGRGPDNRFDGFKARRSAQTKG
jgi:hypothetical protein